MKLLLDTHPWLWFHLGDPQLTEVAKNQILDPANAKFVSPASFWEISLKIALGKYVLNKPYRQFMQEAIEGQGFRILQITPDHTECVTTLPFHHRDPFDRLIVAQSQFEQLPLISADSLLDIYGIQREW